MKKKKELYNIRKETKKIIKELFEYLISNYFVLIKRKLSERLFTLPWRPFKKYVKRKLTYCDIKMVPFKMEKIKGKDIYFRRGLELWGGGN